MNSNDCYDDCLVNTLLNKQFCYYYIFLHCSKKQNVFIYKFDINRLKKVQYVKWDNISTN